MDLVDDDGINGPQTLACLRREHQEQGFRRRDQDVRCLAQKLRALLRRRVSCPNRNRRQRDRDALSLGDVGDADERRTQIALDVDGQRFQR
jgi:hypothetical protein